jgi:hypothetical protein
MLAYSIHYRVVPPLRAEMGIARLPLLLVVVLWSAKIGSGWPDQVPQKGSSWKVCEFGQQGRRSLPDT